MTLSICFVFRMLNTSSLLCDCQLKWLHQWLTHNHLQDAVSVTCAHPELLAGQSILSVNPEDFICGLFVFIILTIFIISNNDNKCGGHLCDDSVCKGRIAVLPIGLSIENCLDCIFL